MSGWSEVFLGVIAVATLAIAIAQIGVMVAATAAVRRLERLADRVEHDVRPILESVNAIGRDAARAASLATLQVERADRVFGDIAVKIEQAMASLESSIAAPARQGRALISAFKAAFEAFRELRQNRSRQGRGDDEDALFI
ncbi:MAG TPA: hypothetical protein VEU08_13440 [Vicinamibacterales bacterium]|nr:hypothetical protein [Vicinamibacterales bacterium]